MTELRPVHPDDRWIVVGLHSANSLLVRGGAKPISIPISHNISEDLFALVKDANAGVEARRALQAKVP